MHSFFEMLWFGNKRHFSLPILQTRQIALVLNVGVLYEWRSI